MTKENLTTLLTTLAGLILVVVGIFWPGQKDLISQIITAVLACAGAILALIWPVKAGAVAYQQAKAKAAYWGAVKAGIVKPRGASGDIPDIVLTYTLADIKLMLDYVIAVAKQVTGSNTPSKLTIAGAFFDKVQRYDLRGISDRFQRVPMMKALVEKAFELVKDAWAELNIPVPGPEICSAPAKHMFELKKQYQAANNQVCGDPVYDKMRNMLGEFNEIYELQYGLEQISDKTVDWSIFDWNSPVGVGLIRENWAKMV